MLSKFLFTFKALYQIFSFCLQHWNVGHEFRYNVFLPQLFTGIYIHNFQSHSQLVCKFTNAKNALYLHQGDQTFHIENWDTMGNLWGRLSHAFVPVCKNVIFDC